MHPGKAISIMCVISYYPVVPTSQELHVRVLSALVLLHKFDQFNIYFLKIKLDLQRTQLFSIPNSRRRFETKNKKCRDNKSYPKDEAGKYAGQTI